MSLRNSEARPCPSNISSCCSAKGVSYAKDMIRFALIALSSLAMAGAGAQGLEAVQLLRSDNWGAAKAFLVTGPEFAPDILKALGDSDVTVRQRAAVALGAMDYLPATQGLKESVLKDQPLVARKALYALLHLARPMRRGKHGEPWDARMSVNEIAELGPKAVPFLIEHVRASEDPDYTHPFACAVLGVIGDRRAIPALISVADRDRGFAMFFAVEALDRFDDPRILPVFARNIKEIAGYGSLADGFLLRNGEAGRLAAQEVMLTSTDPHVRGTLAYLLGRFEDYRSAPALRRALNDPDEFVRSNARYALDKIYAARKKRSLSAYNKDYGRHYSTKYRT